jgi:type VI protein secretion system component Hcp
MDSDSGDLLMKIMPETGSDPVPGASQTELLKDSPLGVKMTLGFKAGGIIELDSFSLRCGTSGVEPGSKPPPPLHEHQIPTNNSHNNGEHTENQPPSIGQTARKGGYQAWRSGRNVKYPLDIQPITVTRPADMSSQMLIQSCIDCVPFKSATIIKRKPVGGGVAAGQTYLRIDFTAMLVIKVDWSDEDDYIKETISFITRAISVLYCPQDHSGNLLSPVPGFWSMVPNMTQAPPG